MYSVLFLLHLLLSQPSSPQHLPAHSLCKIGVQFFLWLRISWPFRAAKLHSQYWELVIRCFICWMLEDIAWTWWWKASPTWQLFIGPCEMYWWSQPPPRVSRSQIGSTPTPLAQKLKIDGATWALISSVIPGDHKPRSVTVNKYIRMNFSSISSRLDVDDL